jgi:hypothetical protein
MFGVLCPSVGIWLAVRGWTTPEPYGWAWAVGYILMATIFLLRIRESRRAERDLRDLEARIRRNEIYLDQRHGPAWRTWHQDRQEVHDDLRHR